MHMLLTEGQSLYRRLFSAPGILCEITFLSQHSLFLIPVTVLVRHASYWGNSTALSHAGHNFLSSYPSAIPWGLVIAWKKVKPIGMGTGGSQSQAGGCIIHVH